MESKKLKLSLNGLDCANCAGKIEKAVSEFKEVSEASLNFSFKLLIIKYDANIDEKDIINKITKVVKDLEPEVEVEKYSLSSNKNVRANNKSVCTDGCCDGHAHDHHEHNHNNSKESSQDEEGNKFIRFLKENYRLVIGIILFIIGMILDENAIILIISYAFVGIEVLLSAVRNICKGKVFDENFLMSIATLGAIAIGQYPEGVAVMVFYEIGEMFQSYAVNRSRKSISELMDIKAEYANLVKGDTTEKVLPEEVKIDDIIMIKPGERVPLDGVIVSGDTSVDSSALTGESMPVNKRIGDELLAGCINNTNVVEVKVTHEFEESTVARILELVQNASSKKASTEKFITKFARYYTPIVVICALALAIIPSVFIQGANPNEWIYRALIFLVVSCPCALVISVPLGLFAGIGGASKKGILVKGGNYLESLKDIDTVVLDKTGTLTKGAFKVTQINNVGISKSELLKYAAICERYSNHPIAKSILEEYNSSNNGNIEEIKIDNHEEVSGKGVITQIQDKKILAGNSKLMSSNGIIVPKDDYIGTVVYVAVNNEYKGSIIISDEIKSDSKEAISELKALGVNKIVMLTGDSKKVADAVAYELGIENVYSELLPGDKVEKVEALLKEERKGKLAFVGDGINDAPVLARADVGVAMGGIGSDAAIEAADVVLMKDEPTALANAIKIGRRTNKILWQNIIFALGIKIIVLILATIGDANMWEAVFADVGVTLIAVINSMRALK
ncbi:MAG: cadmium-translocating P-type ATPase [Clostridium baratii]|uniref:Cd(2+)-exporting ATPase n=1 Tax=Clostridium baratii str. Sullivan TaxID=1415775 RepID=A0A0A7FXW6_9CLOT|nr:heavy metal translocating P-type ATPase [Clostridium baratii]AIY84423.1 cadmium-translocating P-type ATPase [Clostridium baratii str. Sullivan]MBS6007456.1 cadmium-translocating P-type ATPase [Clostridium baratii]MDU1054811.1 heavy metal translocating P-type ATPase [Clostridium baratii]